MKIIINPESTARIKGNIMNIISDFNTRGEKLYEGRNVIKAFTIGEGKDAEKLIVKKFGKPNIFQHIGKIGRATKGERAYHNGLRLLQSGISTPQPYAYVEITRKEFYYVTAEDTGLPLEEMPRTEANANALVDFFIMLHDRGILHNDLNRTNTLYHVRPDGSLSFSVIDINRMSFRNGMPSRKECLYNIFRWDDPTDFFKEVLKLYMQKRGWYDEKSYQQAVKWKEQRDSRYIRKKARLRKLKNLVNNFSK